MSFLPRAVAGALAALLGTVSGCDGRVEFDRRPGLADSAGAASTGSDCSICDQVGLYCASEWQACVECNEDAQCPSQAPYCDQALHRCAACSAAGGCGSGNVCDGWSHTCLRGCGSDVDPDHDCHGSNLTCDLERGVCTVCGSDADCGDVRAHRCLPGGARCAECIGDADCGVTAPKCDPLAFACVECRDSRDCAAPRWCDPQAHHCEPHDR